MERPNEQGNTCNGFKIANSNFSYKVIKRYTHNQNKEKI